MNPAAHQRYANLPCVETKLRQTPEAIVRVSLDGYVIQQIRAGGGPSAMQFSTSS